MSQFATNHFFWQKLGKHFLAHEFQSWSRNFKNAKTLLHSALVFFNPSNLKTGE